MKNFNSYFLKFSVLCLIFFIINGLNASSQVFVGQAELHNVSISNVIQQPAENEVVIEYGAPLIAFPEINVYQGSTPILNSTDLYEYGDCNAGNTIDVVFEIRNTTATASTLSVFDISQGEFTFVGTLPTNVAGNSSEFITIRFAPTAGGSQTCTVSFENDDADENPYSFDLYGNGIAAPTTTTIWNGSTLNWSNGIPDATKDAVISENYADLGFTANSLTVNAGKTFQPTGEVVVLNAFNNNGTTILQNCNLNLQGTNNNNGTERFVTTKPVGNWSFVGLPNGAQLSQAVFMGDYLYHYNEETTSIEGAWTNVVFNETIQPMEGFLLWAQNTATQTFNGTFNHGVMNFPVTNTAGGIEAGWNLVSNPYPTTVFWDKIFTQNNTLGLPFFTGQIAVWTGTSYDYYTSHPITPSGNVALNSISPTAAFMVKVTGNSVYTIDNYAKNASAGGKFASPTQIRIQLSNNTFSDGMYIAQVNEANNIFVEGEDTKKLFSLYEEVPQIYSLTDDFQRVAINAIPTFNNNETFSLGIKIFETGTFSISATDFDNFNSQTVVYLEDLYTGNNLQLNTKESYSFTSEAGTFDDRFVIHFSNSATNVDDISENNNVYSYNNKIYVNVATETMVEIYDVNGRLLRMEKVSGFSIFENFTTGVYVIKTITEGKVEVAKVLVN